MNFLHTLVHRYEAVHTALGILGNLLFVIGSVLFFEPFEDLRTLGVSLFVAGSCLMLVGALGAGLKRCWRYFDGQPQPEDVLPEIYGDYTLARFSSAAGNAASRTDSGACRQEG
ncbi:MAG: YrhK family protein [Sneathiellaceae bacterium]